MSTLRIEARRGQAVESAHRVSVAVVDAEGRRVAAAGDARFPTFMRSAAKPFQAMPVVADGAAARFAITSAELALACASHNSEWRQVEIVEGLLTRIGCKESALACGPHRALALDLGVHLAGESRPDDLWPAGRLASNCSGKHTAMLALAVSKGWPTDGYHRAGHPVQERCRGEVARWMDLRPEQIGEGIDGCGVVSFQVPLEAMALGFARLGVSDEPAAMAVRGAMLQHPELVAGRRRLCTAAMQAYPGAVIAKVGADGVYGVTLPTRGLGVALKVEDGHPRATMVALVAVLERLELAPSPRETLSRFAEFPLVNTRDEPVGVMRASGDLTFE
ncbi:MAG: asparaginase [Gemmatimonadota bacterium]|nr:asparaginase [Gemmatimonadota bacterium]